MLFWEYVGLKQAAKVGLLATALLTLDSGTGHAQSPLRASPPLATAPYAGHVNYAHHSPNFRWGWFGAEHFYPTVKWHRGYNGEQIRWSRHRRY